MNQQATDFIKQILEKIKYKKIHPYIECEIQDHIEMLKEEYIQEGLNEQEAYNKAILHMGDAQQIGTKLNETHKPHTEWAVIVLVASLLITSFIITIIVKSTIKEYIDISLIRKLIYMIISIIAFICSYFLDYKVLKRYSLSIYLFAIALMAFTQIFGLKINGKRFLLGFNILPILILFWLLSYIVIAQKFFNKKNNWLNTSLFFVATIIPIILIKSLSAYNALVLIVGFLSIISFYIYKDYNIKTKIKKIIVLCTTLAVCAIPIIYKVFKYEYIQQRIKSLMFHNKYQLYIKELIENAKLFGSSDISQNEVFKSFVFSNRFNFNLTLLITKAGLISGVLLIIIIALMMIRMFRIVLSVREEYGKILSISILAVFSMKFIINILISLGLLPVADSYMPFITDGGSHLIMDMSMLGIFLGVYRRKDILLPD